MSPGTSQNSADMSDGSSPERLEKTPVIPPTEEEPVPHLHGKTLMVVLAINFIYFAQVFNIVGGGSYARSIAAVVGDAQDATWLSSSFTILTVALGPPVSQAADYWGRRWFLIVLTGFGFVGCIIVARANTMGMAIAGECISGLSGGVQPLLHAVISEVLPRKYRPMAQGAVNVSASAAALVGVIVGNAFVRNNNPEGFRNYWYIAAAIYAVATLICVGFYDPPVRELQLSLTFSDKLRALDWIGFALLPTGLVLFCMGLTWAENPYPWSDAHVLAPLIIGIALVGVLIIYEWKFKSDGMFHHGLFSRDRNFAIALGCVFVEGLVYFAGNAYFVAEVSTLYETDVLISGVRYSLTFVYYIIASILSGWYCSRAKSLRWPIVFSFACFVTFNICAATAGPGSSKAMWAYPLFLGTGLGVCLPALITASQLSTPPELIALTSGLMIAIRSLGGSVGLAVYQSIYEATLTPNLMSKVSNATLPLGLPSSSLPSLLTDLASAQTTAIPSIPGITPTILAAAMTAAKLAFTLAYRYVWVSAGCFSAVALVASTFLFDSKKDFNLHIDAPAETEESLYSEDVDAVDGRRKSSILGFRRKSSARSAST